MTRHIESLSAIVEASRERQGLSRKKSPCCSELIEGFVVVSRHEKRIFAPYGAAKNPLFLTGNPARTTGQRSCAPSRTRAILRSQITEAS